MRIYHISHKITIQHYQKLENLRCNSRIEEAINDTQKVKLNSRSSFCHEYSEQDSWEAETMSGTYLWTECGYRHAASWRFFIFTVPFTKLKINSLVVYAIQAFAAPLWNRRSICARSIANNPHDDTKRAQLPHGELGADWRDSRFCTLSNPRRPVLPGREYCGESIARVIDASADVAFIWCVGNPVLERRDTLHGRVISSFFSISSGFVEFRSAMRRVTYVCW